MQNQNICERIIALQQANKGPKRVIEEIGANIEVGHTLQQCSGSSTVIQKLICSYEQEEQKWNLTNKQASHRSVSKEFINLGLDRYTRKHPDSHIFINSFQTETDPQKVTHGRIGIQQQTGERLLMHLTLPEPRERTAYQQIIGNIGLQAIQQILDNTPLQTPYIDHVMTGSNSVPPEQNIFETIRYMQKDSLVCVNASGQLCRIEDITRKRTGYQPLILYKGSFNPPHNGHLHIMETLQKKYPTHVPLIAISIDTYNKGTIAPEDIIKRVTLRNTLGYSVVLFGSGFFKDNVELLRYKNQEEIIFPVGYDTVSRLLETYVNHDKLMNDFKDVRFESFGRETFSLPDTVLPEIFTLGEKNPYSEIQASVIRNDITKNMHHLPEAIHQLCLEWYRSTGASGA